MHENLWSGELKTGRISLICPYGENKTGRISKLYTVLRNVTYYILYLQIEGMDFPSGIYAHGIPMT